MKQWRGLASRYDKTARSYAAGLEGSLYKGDWYTTEDDAVRVGSELNRHYFHASGEVTVRVIVEIDTSEGRNEVNSIVLRDVPDEGR